jgi:hypothetical protein
MLDQVTKFINHDLTATVDYHGGMYPSTKMNKHGVEKNRISINRNKLL